MSENILATLRTSAEALKLCGAQVREQRQRIEKAACDLTDKALRGNEITNYEVSQFKDYLALGRRLKEVEGKIERERQSIEIEAQQLANFNALAQIREVHLT